MEIYITKHALSSFIEVAEATINPKNRIATLTATGEKYLRCDYELTEEAAIAQCRAAKRKAVEEAEALIQFLRTEPLCVEWCEQGKRKLRLVTEG